MQQMSVERTFCILLYVYGRGRRSSSRTAHRLRLRSSPRTLTPSFLLSEKSHAASLLLACKRARDAPTCYQLFSVSGGRVLCLSSCRERTPGVPRWKTRANAIRTVDGKTLYYRKNYTINCFNQCNKCPSNARFVIFCLFSVADAAGAAALRF